MHIDERTANAILAGLNEEQRLAAKSLEGPVIIIAGAGAGKTTTLIRRSAMLLASGVPSGNILIVTFTNKAAAEISERLLHISSLVKGVSSDQASHIVAGTFHGIIFKHLIKKYPESTYLQAIGLNATECSIIDQDESLRLMKESMASLGKEDASYIDAHGVTPYEILEEISLYRSNGSDVNAVMALLSTSSENVQFNALIINAWRKYNRLCREAGGLDFDDILLVAIGMLSEQPKIAKELANIFTHIMLDEYQDTNVVQMRIMDAIAAHHGNICVVGDEKQSIYGWRGAEIGVMLSFLKRYPSALQVNMNRNYRSTSEILTFANAIAGQMTQKLSNGVLIPEGRVTGAGRPAIVEFGESIVEAELVCRAIRRDLSKGVPANEVAVLYRNRYAKTQIERQLVMSGTPYQVVGDRSFYGKAEVKDALAMIRFMVCPWDTSAGLRVLGSARLGVSQNAAKKHIHEHGGSLISFLEAKQHDRLKALKSKNDEPMLTASARKIRPYLELSHVMRGLLTNGPGNHKLFRSTLGSIWDIYFKIKASPSESASRRNDSSEREKQRERERNVDLVFDKIEDEIAAGQDIVGVLDEFAFLSDAARPKTAESETGIKLMTIHAAKGLEFDNVYLIGIDDDAIPGTDSKDEIEEERRIFYVGVTRARKRLSISFSRLRYTHGLAVDTQASRFIQELEDSLRIRRKIYEVEGGVAVRNSIRIEAT